MSGHGSRVVRERKLPVGQFTIMSMVRISEPIALTASYPYLPAMIESFPGVKPADVGFWTGTVSASFSIAQAATAIPWGRASDRFGRKPVLLICLLNTMIMTLIWGFSTSLPMALLARALLGAGNGNVGIIRTMVAELCPWKELQPRAFSLMPLVFSIGSIIGPIIGGTMANPMNKPAGDRSEGSLLWKYPYALPNLVAAGFFLLSIAIGFLFLQETLADVGRRDYGIMIGRQIIKCTKRAKTMVFNQHKYSPIPTEPKLKLLTKGAIDEESADSEDEQPIKLAPPSWKEALTNQTILMLVSYTFLAMHNTAFDQVISVFMHSDRVGPEIVVDQLPLRFNKGFGLASNKIGLFFTLNGVIAMIFQSLVFPPVARRFGTLKTVKFSLTLMAIVYAVIPFTTLVEPTWLRESLVFIVWMCKTFSTTFAFPGCTILLTNSASSLRILGTVNGITTSIGALGRAFGPSLVGATFTWGIEKGYLVAPFWVLSVMGFCALPPLIFAIEGDGFGDEEIEDESNETEELLDDEGNANDVEAMLSPTGAMRLRRTSISKHGDLHEKIAETVPLDIQHLQAPDMFENVIASDNEDDGDGLGPDQRSRSPLLQPQFPRTRLSRGGSRPKGSRKRSTTPLGSGVGFRRLSSNLGATMSGYGSGSEL